MKQFFLFISLFVNLHTFAQIPSSIRGNWINSVTNEWEYGFYDQFVIYESDFWEYASFSEKKDKISLTIRKGDQNINLVLTLKKDTTLEIKSGKQKNSFILMKKRYPEYKVKDQTSFPDPTFKKDSATIIGYYHNFYNIPQEQRGKSTFQMSVYDFTSDEAPDYLTTIDSLGRFTLTFPLRGTQQCFADWRKNRLFNQLILSPGDTLFLFADMQDLIYSNNGESWNDFLQKDKQILFMGKNARVNNEIIQYKAPAISFDRYKEVKNNIRGMAFLKKAKAVYDERMDHFKKYLQSHPTVSDKFVFSYTEIQKYSFASDLMLHQFDLNRDDKERFESGYLAFIETNFPLNDPRVYTMTQDFKSFLSNYLGYYEDAQEITFTITLEMIENEMEQRNILDEEIRRNFVRLNEFNKQYEAETDSLKKIELIKKTEPLNIEINNNPLIKNTINELFTDYFFQKEFEISDSILSPLPVLKELWDASRFYELFDHNRLPLSKNQMAQLDERIRIPDIKTELLNTHNYYTELATKTFTNEESFKNTNHLNQITDPDELFRKLIEPYKGNVIYLDFWGTWCNPCRENMKLIGAIEKQLHDKNVIFMYLANHSPEETWKNIVREMDLTGEKIVHYRLPKQLQTALEKHLSVYSFPTYMLIDKNGELVNKEAPSPRKKEQLLQEIYQLLK